MSQNKDEHSNFYPLEVVGRDSETQLQVGETISREMCKQMS